MLKLLLMKLNFHLAHSYFYKMDSSTLLDPHQPDGSTLWWTTLDLTMDKESESTSMEQKLGMTEPRAPYTNQQEMAGLLLEDGSQIRMLGTQVSRLMNWSSLTVSCPRLKLLLWQMPLNIHLSEPLLFSTLIKRTYWTQGLHLYPILQIIFLKKKNSMSVKFYRQWKSLFWIKNWWIK